MIEVSLFTYILLVVAGAVVVGGILSIFAVVSNNRRNVETLEDANERLMEMRKEYDVYCEKNEQ